MLTSAAGSVFVAPPTSGSAGNNQPATLTFESWFPDIYDPDVNGSLDLFIDQSFVNTDANWSNIVVTLEDYVMPTLPLVEASLNASGFGDFQSHTNNSYGAGEIVWIELTYDGVNSLTIDTEGTTGVTDTEIALFDSRGFLLGSDDDGGTGLLSSATFPTLDAGT